jgi:hypothetical protein
VDVDSGNLGVYGYDGSCALFYLWGSYR